MTTRRTCTTWTAVMALAVTAVCASGVAVAQSQDVDRDTMLEMVTRLQRLEAEIQSLRGQIEVQQNEIETLKRRQRDQYLDIDRRVQQFENLGITQSTPGVTGGPSGRQAQPEYAPPEVRAPVDAQLETAGVGRAERPDTVALANPAAEREAYERAFALLKQQRYEEAAGAFEAFLGDYPGGEYADNAQYWLAESNYVQRNFRPALEDFEKVLVEYPDSSKVPDAELKIGFIHYELKDWDRARAVLNQVTSSYPGTTVARLAEDRLRLMRIEGR